MRRRWIFWLVALVVIVAVGEGLGLLLSVQGAPTIGGAIRWICRLLAAGWIGWGLYAWRQVKWVKRVTWIVGATVVAALAAGLCQSLGSVGGLIAVLGVYAMAMGFYVGMLLIRLILLPGTPMMGVARTLVDEAIRMKVPLIFIVALVLIVPVLPFSMDPSELLQYRIQSFLSWSMMSVFMLLSLMTIFLAVGTIANEIDHRHIYLTLTKPVSRLQYLAGKWLGIVLLDLVLVVVAGAGIYSFTRILERQPARSARDREAVEDQVLVARETLSPVPVNPSAMQRRFTQILAKARRDHPRTFGMPGMPTGALSDSARSTIEQRAVREWYTVGPRESQTYRFADLGNVTGPSVQLRIKPESAGSATFVWLQIRINGRYYYLPHLTHGPGVIKLAAGDYHVLSIPSSVIGDKGRLDIQIANPPRAEENQATVNFNPKDGIEVLYQVGGFEGNLVRALVVLWVRLGFLAMLGLAAGSFLSFPIASLLCVMIYLAASGSTYLHSSLKYYTAFPRGSSDWAAVAIFFHSIYTDVLSLKLWKAVQVIIAAISTGFLKLVPAFGTYSPTPLLAGGRMVSWQMIGQSLLWVGLVWTGAVAVCGYLIFRLRELARVTV